MCFLFAVGGVLNLPRTILFGPPGVKIRLELIMMICLSNVCAKSGIRLDQGDKLLVYKGK